MKNSLFNASDCIHPSQPLHISTVFSSIILHSTHLFSSITLREEKVVYDDHKTVSGVKHNQTDKGVINLKQKRKET